LRSAVPWVRPGDARRPSAFTPHVMTLRNALGTEAGHHGVL